MWGQLTSPPEYRSDLNMRPLAAPFRLAWLQSLRCSLPRRPECRGSPAACCGKLFGGCFRCGGAILCGFGECRVAEANTAPLGGNKRLGEMGPEALRADRL